MGGMSQIRLITEDRVSWNSLDVALEYVFTVDKVYQYRTFKELSNLLNVMIVHWINIFNFTLLDIIVHILK